MLSIKGKIILAAIAVLFAIYPAFTMILVNSFNATSNNYFLTTMVVNFVDPTLVAISASLSGLAILVLVFKHLKDY
ncbi:hypothetical protein ACFQ3J_21015 [Paenibacillus provencensis]|uniref:Uncharacterized protein n=1 Tax=Paenibacillus provencensis TaxID=441151 RepID=A0ABW3Q0S2_9BACL